MSKTLSKRGEIMQKSGKFAISLKYKEFSPHHLETERNFIKLIKHSIFSNSAFLILFEGKKYRQIYFYIIYLVLSKQSLFKF